MSQLKDILFAKHVLLSRTIASKKRALELLAKTVVIDNPELDEIDVFEQLIAREKLGSTGFGDGVAIPHCRMANCKQPICALLRLATPIDFDAIDENPVDILVVLLAPEKATDEHLQLLKQIASLLGDGEARAALRGAKDNQELFDTVIKLLTTAG